MNSPDTDTPTAQPDAPVTTGRSRRRLPRTVAVLAVAGGLAVAGIGVAAAQSSSTTPSTSPAPPGPKGGERPGRHPGGFGMGRGVIHGEFVRPDGNGGYQTIDTQVGTVTSVDASSITVKSADGFSKTYGVTSSTLVDAGRDGIGSVKTGDTVRVLAKVEGSSATAFDVEDVTNLRTLRQQWSPRRPAAPNGATSTTPA